MGKRARTDWDAIRTEYEGGTASLRDLAEPHHITEAAIRKKAKAAGWVRGGITLAKRRLVEEKLLRSQSTQDGANLESSQEVRTAHFQMSRSIELAAEHDAEFMLRVARGAEQSVKNCERLLLEASAAIDMAQQQDWRETILTVTEGDGDPNGNSTKTTTKTPGRLDLVFDAGKVTKISTEALQIARKTYALARGLEDGTESAVSVNVNAQAQAGAVANASAMPLDARLVEFRRAAIAALAREPEPPPPAASGEQAP